MMRHDPTIIASLREAVRQAIRNLESLKMVRPNDDDPELAKLMHVLQKDIRRADEGSQTNFR
jgi:hypothetical protein